MLSFLPGPVKGTLAVILLIVNLLSWFVFLIPFALIKLCFPVPMVRKPMDFFLNLICTKWANCNKMFLMFLNDITWDIEGDEGLSMKKWYLVLANHQSWADIVVLQYVLNDRIPYFRFFLKKELVWIPVFNFVWYALDYPYMKRYSSAFLKKNPHLKGKDIETTKKSCERFKHTPVSVMNFVEGTRFTPVKHARQQSPFTYLLKPKAGGIAFVLAAMGDLLTEIIDVTITYAPSSMGFWDFLCGRVTKVTVHLRKLPVSDEIKGDYFGDSAFRGQFQSWVNTLWVEKDALLKRLRGQPEIEN